MDRFVILGAAGSIAPRHMEAIKGLGHELIAAFDPNDSVGILDRYFPTCAFFTRLEQLDSFLSEARKKVDFVSICSPSFLHVEGIRWALEKGADAICESPLVLSVREVDELLALERKTKRRINPVLPYRAHPEIRLLRDKILKEKGVKHNVDLTSVTPHGSWYMESWKGNPEKSGGLAFNIGVPFFDMLTWTFGSVREMRRDERSSTNESGFLQLERANVNWQISIDRQKPSCQSIKIDCAEFKIGGDVKELYKTIYQEITNGDGKNLEDTRTSIAVASS